MKNLKFIFLLIAAISVGTLTFFLTRQKTIKAGKTGLFVINVLDEEYYQDCHIKGSVHVPFDHLESYVESLDKEKAEIVVYCSNYMCSTSEHAYKVLTRKGFKNVWAYEGGMAEWYQMGYPVEGMCSSSYLSVPMKAPDFHDSAWVITAQKLAEKMNSNAAA